VANVLLLESGTDGYLLEDSTGVLLIDMQPAFQFDSFQEDTFQVEPPTTDPQPYRNPMPPLIAQ
jgi:hypothetical protein